jgi:AAA15 family ATPase/GTPase
VFERDKEGVYLCEELEGIDIENMNESLPLFSYIAMLKNIPVIDRAMSFFMQIKVLNYDKPNVDRRILVDRIENDKVRVCNVIQSMGIDICDIRVEYKEDGSIDEIYTIHELSSGEKKTLRLSEESGGTKKIISIIPILLSGIEKNSLFLIDELDAKLHPLLLRKIIELFTDREINSGTAQLLFTSHDLTTMSNDVLRRDEIWFSAINGYDESVLYSLVDFRKEGGNKPRNDENYSKQYMEGRYGADPYFKKLIDWEVSD